MLDLVSELLNLWGYATRNLLKITGCSIFSDMPASSATFEAQWQSYLPPAETLKKSACCIYIFHIVVTVNIDCFPQLYRTVDR
jgi:hypothetical protein